MRFAGQVFDGQAGLHQNGFRDYDPASGGYIESDPTGLGGGINTYAYVGGNPLTLVDPLGLTQQDINEMTCFARQNNPDLTIPDPAVEDIPNYMGYIVGGYVNHWPWSKPVINSLYLKPLSADDRVGLYNTIIHESWHYDKQPFYNRSSPAQEREAYKQADTRAAKVADKIKKDEIGKCKCGNGASPSNLISR